MLHLYSPKQDLISNYSHIDHYNQKGNLCVTGGDDTYVDEQWPASGGSPRSLHPSHPCTNLTPADSSLSHFSAERSRKKRINTCGTGGAGGFTGCCLSFRSCLLPFSQEATLVQVHKQPTPKPPAPPSPPL